MSTYKVLQDIEAEDKFLGPLTLKQFIFACIGLLSGYLGFLTLTKGLWPITLALLPFLGFSVLLAFPWSRDQPTEVWLLAKVRFHIKPRKRIWDQTGLKELVTITVPKKIDQHLTNGLSQVEVRSRLHALANTIDSRGWAIKNMNVNLYSQPGYLSNPVSDRLVDPLNIPQEVPATVVTAQDDVFDNQSVVAQQFDSLMSASAATHKQQLVAQMQSPQPATSTQSQPADYWFMQNAPQAAPKGMATFDPALVLPGTNNSSAPAPTAEEEALLNKAHEHESVNEQANSHLKTIQPLSQKPATKSNASTAVPPVTAPVDPAILELAKNDDLNVATIARQAKRNHDKQLPDDEVVISLR